MKRILLSILTASLLLLFIPMQSNAAEGKRPVAVEKAKTEISVEAKAMINRLNEIKAMDVSKLSSTEKKELRTEVRTIKSDLKAQDLNSSGGVYLSAGALILIILLLIILL